jgi:protein involved in polysaccharide export with SLBB domain
METFGCIIATDRNGLEVEMLGAKTCRFWFGATVFLCEALCSGVLSAQTPQDRVEGPLWYYEYYIYPGDALRISAYQHPRWSKTVVVTPNGEIILPSLDATKVAGLTVQAASDLLRKKLGDRSCVTVTVKRRKGPWVLQKEPFFIDVPPPSYFDAINRDS